MQIDDITKAASERLAALDAEAKPHEDALAAISAERDRLRLVVAAGKGEHLYKVAPLSPPSVLDSIILTTPHQWVPARTGDWTIDPHGTQIVCGTTALGAVTISGASPPDPSASLVVPSCTTLS